MPTLRIPQPRTPPQRPGWRLGAWARALGGSLGAAVQAGAAPLAQAGAAAAPALQTELAATAARASPRPVRAAPMPAWAQAWTRQAPETQPLLTPGLPSGLRLLTQLTV